MRLRLIGPTEISGKTSVAYIIHWREVGYIHLIVYSSYTYLILLCFLLSVFTMPMHSLSTPKHQLVMQG